MYGFHIYLIKVISGLLCVIGQEDEQMDLPPGFRFHPTDEELISHYLYKKVLDINFSAKAIGEVDLNKSEPWELPWKAKMGEKEWYFFCVRDRKYPTGLRTNRATDSGYWKATGKDKEIYKGKSLVEMKKTLVFLHNEWVICRVFQKSSGGKKTHISGLVNMSSFGNELVPPSNLPPFMNSSSAFNAKKNPVPDSVYVPCFSNPIDVQHHFPENPLSFPRIPAQNTFFSAQQQPLTNFPSNIQFPGSVLMQEQSILRDLLENNGSNMKTEREAMVTVSQETGLTTDINNEISSVVSNLEIRKRPFDDQQVGPVDFNSFWHY